MHATQAMALTWWRRLRQTRWRKSSVNSTAGFKDITKVAISGERLRQGRTTWPKGREGLPKFTLLHRCRLSIPPANVQRQFLCRDLK
jgi:hypothetical protein